MITALPLLLKPTKQDKNVTFHCEFHVDEDDRALFDGVAVGVWERGEISLTLMTVTSNYNIVINPKLYQEGPEYNQRVYGYLSTNNTNNATRLTVELKDVTESGDRSYGCSMYFGPFREPLGSSLSIDVEGKIPCLQPRSQGLSSSRPRKRKRGDPGWGWSRVSQNLGDYK